MKSPTKSELEILRVLWTLKRGTVRQVNTVINRNKKQGYTTTLKFMQIMEEKGLLNADTSNRAHIFSSKLKENKVKRDVIKNLLANVFNNSLDDLLVQAISAKPLSKDELVHLKELIKEAESKLEN
ncbi:MAG: transcriptional regulator [Planctomycetota bacterium]|nr:MAG: transcriptional regulator [Planctomycetota bacterium]